VWDLPPVALKRLGLAAAFTSGAPWLFLDEPALGLDSEGRVALGHLLWRAAECGRGIIVVSHGEEFDCLPSVQLLGISGRALHTGGAQ
jgi:DNA repair exonuclease SbcCD ATPase subunit